MSEGRRSVLGPWGWSRPDLPRGRLPLGLGCPVALSISGGEDFARVNRWRTENVLAAQTKSTAWRKSFVKKRLENGEKASESGKTTEQKELWVSKGTVHRHMKKFGGVKSYKRSRQPKITEKQRKDRIRYCKMVNNWTVNKFKQVIWSNEAPFEILHTSNPQNDRVWARNVDDVPPRTTVKNPCKIMVWGAMSAQGLSELHFVPKAETVNADYYVDEILTKSLLPALNRSATGGSVLETKMVPGRSRPIFMQDGAPLHTSNRTQDWCRLHVLGSGRRTFDPETPLI